MPSWENLRRREPKPRRCCGSTRGSQLKDGNVSSSTRTPSIVLMGYARQGSRRLEPRPPSAVTGADFDQLEPLIDGRRRVIRRRILRYARLQKGFRAGKRFCSASPLNNHTFILYFYRNAARRSGGLSYQRRSIPVIPCSG